MKYLFKFIYNIVVFAFIVFVLYPIKIYAIVFLNILSVLWNLNFKNTQKIDKNIFYIQSFGDFGRKDNRGVMRYKYFYGPIKYLKNEYVWK